MKKPKTTSRDPDAETKAIISYLRYAVKDVRALSILSSHLLEQAIDVLIDDLEEDRDVPDSSKHSRSRH